MWQQVVRSAVRRSNDALLRAGDGVSNDDAGYVCSQLQYAIQTLQAAMAEAQKHDGEIDLEAVFGVRFTEG